jgi:hypothetical protein
MSFTHIIMPAAGLQPFELGAQSIEPFVPLAAWQEVVAQRIELHEDSLSLPWEIAYARALEIPSDEGAVPWAAFETQTIGAPCAWVHPCHLDVGMTDMVMQPTSALRLTDAESRELHALMAPYFEQDGITLTYHSATRWLALGSQFADFECASLALVQGRSINDFLADAGEFPQALKLSRLQAEMQMLLYTHPISEARQARGLPTVNSFWVDAAGVLDAMPASNGAVRLDFCLAEAAHDEQAYRKTWQSLILSAEELAAKALANQEKLHLTFCGERAAITLQPRKSGFKQQFLSIFSPLRHRPAKNMREVL